VGKKSTKTPDVKGAAKVDADAQRDISRDETYANRPDQYNAFGNNTWGQEMVTDPATGEKTTKWTQKQELTPEMQRLLDSDMQRNTQLGETAAGMGDRIDQEMGAPLDWQQFGDVEDFDPTANRQRAEDDAYGRSTQRMDPKFASDRATLERQMAGRGLRAGDSAYDSAMQNFDTGKNDAYEMARMGATSEGRAETGLNLQTNERSNALRQQKIQEYLGKRGQSLSESNALKGSQNVGDMTNTFSGGQ
jgi:hypothetical protein